LNKFELADIDIKDMRMKTKGLSEYGGVIKPLEHSVLSLTVENKKYQ